MNKILSISLQTIFLIVMISFLYSCNGKKYIKGNSELPITKPKSNLKKAVFYLENSESMFGYVNGVTDFVDVVSELSEKPDFVEANISREFYFINGSSPLRINSIGNVPSALKSKLNPAGFRIGDVTKSDLTFMFKMALEKAHQDTISILISDAIYDVGVRQAPLNELILESRATRSEFISQLKEDGLQTLIIKLSSNFNGNYFYASCKGKEHLNQKRPYYIFIFGKSELLNKYFSQKYLEEKLKGYVDYARFFTISENEIPYQVIPSINRLGTFKPDSKNKNWLRNTKLDRNNQGVQFSIGVDFSSLPFSESYLTSVQNYSSNLNYDVVQIEPLKNNQKYEVTSFSNPTHAITVHTNRSPYGELEILLKNKIPDWIIKTGIDNENEIKGDTTHTFGFKVLTDAISEAYGFKNKEKNLATFKISITK